MPEPAVLGFLDLFGGVQSYATHVGTARDRPECGSAADGGGGGGNNRLYNTTPAPNSQPPPPSATANAPAGQIRLRKEAEDLARRMDLQTDKL